MLKRVFMFLFVVLNSCSAFSQDIGQKRILIGQNSLYYTVRDYMGTSILDSLFKPDTDSGKVLVINYCDLSQPFDENKELYFFMYFTNERVYEFVRKSNDNISFRCLNMYKPKAYRRYILDNDDTSEYDLVERKMYKLYTTDTADFDEKDFQNFKKLVKKDIEIYDSDEFLKINMSFIYKYLYLESKVKNGKVGDTLRSMFDSLYTELFHDISKLDYQNIYWIMPNWYMLNRKEHQLSGWDPYFCIAKRGKVFTGVNRRRKPKYRKFKNRNLSAKEEYKPLSLEPGIEIDIGIKKIKIPSREDFKYIIINQQNFGPFH